MPVRKLEAWQFVEMFYSLPDPGKAVRWHVPREEAVRFFYEQYELLRRHWPEIVRTRDEVRAYLELGCGKILGLEVVLSDEAEVRLEVKEEQ